MRRSAVPRPWGGQQREPVAGLAQLPGRRAILVVPADRHARTDQRESPDKTEPTLAAEPIEKAEATEPTEPMERIEPAEPMERIEPAEPMDKIDPLDPMLRSEPAEPPGRGAPSVVFMGAFSQPRPISGTSAVPCRQLGAARAATGSAPLGSSPWPIARYELGRRLR
jgi:hypothetical protein